MSILRKLSKLPIIWLAVLAVVFILIFFAVGIATNLFASPVFSMFWIISAEAAHGVVLYAAVALAVILGVGMTTFLWLKKRENENSSSRNKLNEMMLAVEKAKAESIKSYESATFKMAAKEESYDESKNRFFDAYLKESEVKADSHPATATRESLLANERVQEFMAESTSESTFESERDAQSNKGKLVCPSCKIEVAEPTLMMNYDKSKPKVSIYCPKCEKLIDEMELDSQKKSSS